MLSLLPLVLSLASLTPLALEPGNRATVDLGEGRQVVGELVKQDDQRVFVDLGYTILAVPREEIVTITLAAPDAGVAGEESETEAEAASGLYRTRGWARASVQENMSRMGEGVVLVRVPGKLGSGFVIHAGGWVITNAHVIHGEQQISITVFIGEDEQGAPAKRVFEDIELVSFNTLWDLALLRIPAEQLGDFELTPLPIGDMQDVRAGDPVFAVGNPLGLEHSVSEGIVSKTNRAASGMLYIQTTAAINGGNSGGPLLNLEGQVIGVNTWGFLMTEGLNFSIPATTLRRFIENRDAFAFDKDLANDSYRYPLPPSRGDED